MQALIEICGVALAIFLTSALLAIAVRDCKTDDTLDKNSNERTKGDTDNAWKTSEQKTGMEKIKELKNRLANLAMTDDRPAVWRICRSLVESLDEIENEHDNEVFDLSHANTALKTELDKANAVINEQMTKIQKLDDEIKNLNARDEDRVSTIKGYQKDLERYSAISVEKEKTIKEVTYERDVRGKAIDTLRKQLADAQEQVRAMSDLANSSMAEAQMWRTESLSTQKDVALYVNGAPVLTGRDADGKIVKYIGTKMVTLQMPYDVYAEQKDKLERQAKEIDALKKRLENIAPEDLGLTMTQCASIPDKRMRWERWERYVSVTGGGEWGS